MLGANDGIVSNASLVLGVTAAGLETSTILLTGTAGLVAGALSMAAGEYVSVSSQADTERADLERERAELAADPEFERAEMAAIYVARGLEPELAAKVATQLMAFDALGAHARDELGITETLTARPLQAAWASAGSFMLGAALPLLAITLAPAGLQLGAVAVSASVFLAALGAAAAHIGGAPVPAAVFRVTAWGALAMALTTAVGAAFGGWV